VQTLLNLLLDIPVIFVILFMNRTTINMRKRLEEEEERRRQVELNRYEITASFIERLLENGRGKEQPETTTEDTQTLDPSERSQLAKSVLTLSEGSELLSDLDTGPTEEQKLFAILQEEYSRRRQLDMAERFIMPDQDGVYHTSNIESVLLSRNPKGFADVFNTTKSQLRDEEAQTNRNLSE